MKNIQDCYFELLDKYDYQGWWPIGNVGYHPGEYDYPRDNDEIFEICIGAILTQNTNWKNVEKALEKLRDIRLINPKKILEADDETLKEAIKSSGYYNQKAERLKIFSKYFLQLDGRTPTREELLELKGIGFETADSILLYAFKIPTFVIDAYTKRFLLKLGLIDEKAKYEDMKEIFEDNLDKDYRIYQEYHALIVRDVKNSTTYK